MSRNAGSCAGNIDHCIKPYTVPSDVLVHNFLRHRLNLYLDGTLVEVRQHRLCVADQEVELLWVDLLDHYSAYDEQVAAPFEHELIGQAAVEGAEHESPDERVLNGAISRSVFSFEVT